MKLYFKLLVNIISISCLTSAFGQSYQTVRGTISEIFTETPIEGAEVMILKDGVTIYKGVSNQNGNFSVSKIELGTYDILFKHISYKSFINPGVEMAFGLDGKLEIPEGASGSKPSLIAVGTEQNPILFTAIDKVEGAWKGIWFDTPSALNEIGFATVEYASNDKQVGAIYAWYGTVLNVHDVLFKDIVK